jgi:hypothetical protein
VMIFPGEGWLGMVSILSQSDERSDVSV